MSIKIHYLNFQEFLTQNYKELVNILQITNIILKQKKIQNTLQNMKITSNSRVSKEQMVYQPIEKFQSKFSRISNGSLHNKQIQHLQHKQNREKNSKQKRRKHQTLQRSGSMRRSHIVSIQDEQTDRKQQHVDFQQKPKIFSRSRTSSKQRLASSYHLQCSSNNFVEDLMKQNQYLKEKEQIYIQKLIKLEQGLEKQHLEFMNLQDVYNDLFLIFKHKEETFAELELRFKETERQRMDFTSFEQASPNYRSRQQQKQQNEANQKGVNIWFQKNRQLQEIIQKMKADLEYYRSKQQLSQSRKGLEKNIFQQMEEWQKKYQQEREQKIKLEYENNFFKMRVQDLQKTVTELQKMLTFKQNQIIKMRQDKIQFRRQSSEKILTKSPPKSNLDSSRMRLKEENKKITKLIQDLQYQNAKLRDQNVLLKQKIKKGSNKENIGINSSRTFFNESQGSLMLGKRLDFHEKVTQNTFRSYQNENFNTQNSVNQQYFSFSRQRQSKTSSESESNDLPTFPQDLEIQNLIQKHTKDSNEERPCFALKSNNLTSVSQQQ